MMKGKASKESSDRKSPRGFYPTRQTLAGTSVLTTTTTLTDISSTTTPAPQLPSDMFFKMSFALLILSSATRRTRRSIVSLVHGFSSDVVAPIHLQRSAITSSSPTLTSPSLTTSSQSSSSSIVNRSVRWRTRSALNGVDVDTTHEHHDTSSTSSESINKQSTTTLKSGREKRRKFIGLAKAVDRGQWQNTYSPGGEDGVSFEAKSGLPRQVVEGRGEHFCVLGIESSCDDTGGEVLICVLKLCVFQSCSVPFHTLKQSQ